MVVACDEAEVALAGMLQVVEQLSQYTSELLCVKEGSSPTPLPAVALKMSQQALALASQVRWGPAHTVRWEGCVLALLLRGCKRGYVSECAWGLWDCNQR